jgi:hypothetical protein
VTQTSVGTDRTDQRKSASKRETEHRLEPVIHPTTMTTTSHNNDLDDEYIVPHSNEKPLSEPKRDPGIFPTTRIHPWPVRLKPWIGYIAKAIEWTPPTPFNATALRFETLMEAAEHNFRVLEQRKFDLQAIITGPESENTPIRPGSEFRPIHFLDRILRNHPLWPRARRTMTRGFTMPLTDIPEMDREQDVREALNYGNHKSTLLNPSVVLEILDDEVKHGWQLVLPSRQVSRIPGTIVSPLGLVQQNSINEHGETIVKWRLTHDQSFQFASETSVNSRVIKDQLAQCMYGSALKRFLHAIVKYRGRFPNTPLLMAKFDLKSAYRRAHFSGISALQSIATNHGLCGNHEENHNDGLAYVSLRFTFGGASNPSEFSTISEMIADLTNTIIQHRDWDPTVLYSKFVALTGERPILEDADIAFAPARELLMDWEMSEFGSTDAYIDDIFTVFPFKSEEHFQRGRNAALLAIDVLGRPTHPNDPLPRDPIIAEKKVRAEGTPTEVLTVLGWLIDTRRMLLKLPTEKANAWDTDLAQLIEDGDAGYEIARKRLESIQGRNNHVARIVPGALHFQSRMYEAIERAKKYRVTRLTEEERHDLRLLRHLLAAARRGISLNNLVSRKPDHIGRSDAYEKGIGGYDLTSGRAWRLAIPTDCQHTKSQNFLEYLACLTQLLCMLTESDWKPGDCFLSVGDNTSALGWIRKSNFKPEEIAEQATHLALARHVTTVLTDLDVIQCGQWLPGSDNGVADVLSRDHETTDAELTQLIVKSYPSQTPSGFQISPLPPEITSWALYWVRHTHEMTESPPIPLQRATRGGSGGSNSSTTVNSRTTSSFASSPNTNGTSYSEPSHTEPATTSGPCPRRDMITWLREHAVPPSTQYARPSSQPVGTIPARTRTANLRLFYVDKSKDTKITTPQNNPKKPYPSESSKN